MAPSSDLFYQACNSFPSDDPDRRRYFVYEVNIRFQNYLQAKRAGDSCSNHARPRRASTENFSLGVTVEDPFSGGDDTGASGLLPKGGLREGAVDVVRGPAKGGSAVIGCSWRVSC